MLCFFGSAIKKKYLEKRKILKGMKGRENDDLNQGCVYLIYSQCMVSLMNYYTNL